MKKMNILAYVLIFLFLPLFLCVGCAAKRAVPVGEKIIASSDFGTKIKVAEQEKVFIGFKEKPTKISLAWALRLKEDLESKNIALTDLEEEATYFVYFHNERVEVDESGKQANQDFLGAQIGADIVGAGGVAGAILQVSSILVVKTSRHLYGELKPIYPYSVKAKVEIGSKDEGQYKHGCVRSIEIRNVEDKPLGHLLSENETIIVGHFSKWLDPESV